MQLNPITGARVTGCKIGSRIDLRACSGARKWRRNTIILVIGTARRPDAMRQTAEFHGLTEYREPKPEIYDAFIFRDWIVFVGTVILGTREKISYLNGCLFTMFVFC